MNLMDQIRAKRGMLARVADELGLARSTVHAWQRVPDKHLVEVERITGIPREELRPDLFRRREGE
jgi:DNA-binding transcriptional regulator YdaS (Cro superfamily)